MRLLLIAPPEGEPYLSEPGRGGPPDRIELRSIVATWPDGIIAVAGDVTFWHRIAVAMNDVPGRPWEGAATTLLPSLTARPPGGATVTVTGRTFPRLGVSVLEAFTGQHSTALVLAGRLDRIPEPRWWWVDDVVSEEEHDTAAAMEQLRR